MIPRYSRPEMASVWSDEKNFGLWLEVEIAACEAWNQLGVVPDEDLKSVQQAKFDIAEYNKIFDETKHDLVAFTRTVAGSVGDAGRWIHYGLTSNDVKDTALAIQLRLSMDLLAVEIQSLMDALKERALEFRHTPCAGRSHGIHAEPMSFGLKFALWWDEMRRHLERLSGARNRVTVCKLSGPVGTFATIPPEVEEFVAKRFGLSPAPVSNQIIQRDRHAEYVQTLALVGATLEKIAVEIRGLHRSEIDEVREPFGKPGYVAKGSSSMPHKRNPEISERICGLARLLRGYSVTALDNVALWHERDISHSSAERVILPDSSLATDYMLGLMIGLIRGLEVNKERMLENINLTKGLLFSSRVMLALIEAGMDRREAYDIVQELSLSVWENNRDFNLALQGEKRVRSLLSESEIDSLFDLGWYMRFTGRHFERLGWKQD